MVISAFEYFILKMVAYSAQFFRQQLEIEYLRAIHILHDPDHIADMIFAGVTLDETLKRAGVTVAEDERTRSL